MKSNEVCFRLYEKSFVKVLTMLLFMFNKMGRYSYSQPSSSSNSSATCSTARQRSGGCYGFPKRCHCGMVPILQTSKTFDNPGRRFYGCTNWDDGGYHLMKWWDEAMMEEFADVAGTVDQLCAVVDNIPFSYAENESVTTLEDDLKETHKEIAHLKGLMVEIEKRFEGSESKRFGGVQFSSLMVVGVGFIAVIVSIWLCLRGSLV